MNPMNDGNADKPMTVSDETASDYATDAGVDDSGGIITVTDGNSSESEPVTVGDTTHDGDVGESKDIPTMVSTPMTELSSYLSAHDWIAPVLILVMSVLASVFNAYDTGDQWFILANGRYVMEHGFPYQNPFSVWGGNFVMENWLWSVIIWLAWSVTGNNQVGPWLVAVIGILSSTALAMVITKESCRLMKASHDMAVPLSGALTAGCLILTAGIRPGLATMVFTLASVLSVVRWMATRKPLHLALVPVWMLIAFNMHMAMAWYVILIPGCFMLADFVMSKGMRIKLFIGYLVTVVASLAVTIVNPYGVNGITFIFRSFGIAKYKNSIVEMKGLVPCLRSSCRTVETFELLSFGVSTVMFLLAVFATVVALTVASRKHEFNDGDRKASVLLFGTIVLWMGMMVSILSAVRTGSFFIVLIPTSMALLLNSPKERGKDTTDALMSSVYAFIVMVGVVVYMGTSWNGLVPWNYSSHFDSSTKSVVARELDKVADKGDTVSVDSILGPMLTYSGYRTDYDARPELISSAITGLDTDHYKEVVDAIGDRNEAIKYVNKYQNRIEWWVSNTFYTNTAYAMSHDKDLTRIASGRNWVLYRSNAYVEE